MVDDGQRVTCIVHVVGFLQRREIENVAFLYRDGEGQGLGPAKLLWILFVEVDVLVLTREKIDETRGNVDFGHAVRHEKTGRNQDQPNRQPVAQGERSHSAQAAFAFRPRPLDRLGRQPKPHRIPPAAFSNRFPPSTRPRSSTRRSSLLCHSVIPPFLVPTVAHRSGDSATASTYTFTCRSFK